jgi:hypothetical protein
MAYGPVTPFAVCVPAVEAARYRYSAPPLPAAGTEGTATQGPEAGSNRCTSPAARVVGGTRPQTDRLGPVLSLPQAARAARARAVIRVDLRDTRDDSGRNVDRAGSEQDTM